MKIIKLNFHTSAWLGVGALFIAFQLLPLMQQGMDMDGLYYGSMARNLAQGTGSFSLLLDPYQHLPFFDHPPLAIWLESLFFKILGDHFFVERLFNLIQILIIFTGITALWWHSFKFLPNKKYWLWLPSLLLILNPYLNNYLSQNYLEVTSLCFCLFACIVLIYRPFLEKNYLLALILAASLLVLGFLSKGPIAFFPLIIPWLTYSIKKEISCSQAIKESTLLIIFFVIIFSSLCFILNLWNYLQHYFINQVLASTIGHRIDPALGQIKYWQPLQLLIYALIPSLLLFLPAAIIVFNKKPKYSFLKTINTQFLFYLILALSASLPTFVSQRYYPHYLLPAIPFFILSFAQYITPALIIFSKKIKINASLFRYGTMLCLIVSLSFFIYSSPEFKQDKYLIQDIKKIGKIIPNNTTIKISKSLYPHWEIHGYFARFYNIQLTRNTNYNYLLVAKNNIKDKNYKLITLPTRILDLYKQQ